jgi:hypothetical protein
MTKVVTHYQDYCILNLHTIQDKNSNHLLMKIKSVYNFFL